MAPDAAAVTRLTLTAFRNYHHVRLDLDERSVVLTGLNGAGKTNLLEAVSLLAPGTGLRQARLGDVGQKDNSVSWAVSAVVAAPTGPITLGTGRDPKAASERRLVRIDGEPASSQADLAEQISILWLTPANDRLFVDAASGRRRFLDRLVIGLDPAHARRVAAYQRSLRERARLLREGGDSAWLDAVEDTMAAHGIAVAAARKDAVERLQAALAAGIGPLPAASLALSGSVDNDLAAMPAVEAETALRDKLKAARQRDQDSGVTGHGPHRSDLEVEHLERGFPAALCSTGEQKALLLAIIFAQARLITLANGRPPVLLLDEVAAHLDETRRAWLVDELSAIGGQAWLTGTDLALFSAFGSRAQYHHVADGAIEPRRP